MKRKRRPRHISAELALSIIVKYAERNSYTMDLLQTFSNTNTPGRFPRLLAGGVITLESDFESGLVIVDIDIGEECECCGPGGRYDSCCVWIYIDDRIPARKARQALIKERKAIEAACKPASANNNNKGARL